MRRPRLLALALSSLVAVALMAAACGDGSETQTTTASGGGNVGGSAAGGNADGGTIFTGGGAQGCISDDDCNGGVCNNGTCCDSVDAVCGDACCESADVCLFEQCVTPGDDCVSEADCPEDHYCEPALGEEGQGGQGANCTQPIQQGKCVPLPPTCIDEPNDPNCVDVCEYFPQAGQLNAAVKWQWGHDPAPTEFANAADVWSTPAVGRIFDANCDGKVDLADPPNVVFVSGDALGTFCSNNAVTNFACRKGVLRMLDGRSGEEIWSLDVAEPGSQGFSGVSVAIGDLDNDQSMDIAALTGEGKLAIIGPDGTVKHLSADIVDGNTNGSFGWGGGLSIGDMDNDGWPEIAYGRTVFTMQGGSLSLLFMGTLGWGGAANTALSHFVDLDGDGDLELLAGNTAYHHDGMPLWQNAAVVDGFTATGDFDGDMLPEVVVVRSGNLYILEGADGTIEIGPHDIPGNGQGGPPTVADFNGDMQPEIGVAMQNFYTMMKPDYANTAIVDLWSTPNHDNSSSVTGSSVFDFEGDGAAEVVYMDECFVWVYDGSTGDILFTANSQSFTATEATIVADVDGDGHAEIVVVHNAANPNSWTCAHHTTGMDGYPIWSPPPAGNYRGVTIYADVANSWVGTRTLWNQHPYSVSNICDPRDSACTGPNVYYGQIPEMQQKNWTLGWLNNFRQNVQDGGLFDAPDAVVNLDVDCSTPVTGNVQLRNQGLAGLPAGIEVGVYQLGATDTLVATVFTTQPLFPGQTEVLPFTASGGSVNDAYQARIIIDPNNITFNECKDDNNESAPVTPQCVN